MPLAVDWAALRAALTCRGEEWSHYLDLRTGDIRRSRFTDFREEGDELAADEVDTGTEEGYLVPVEPVPYAVEHRWMLESCALLPPAQGERLLVALRSRRPLHMFREALVGDPVALSIWRAFRHRRLGAAAREWLVRRASRP